MKSSHCKAGINNLHHRVQNLGSIRFCIWAFPVYEVFTCKAGPMIYTIVKSRTGKASMYRVLPHEVFTLHARPLIYTMGFYG